jgi:hypothetical protein
VILALFAVTACTGRSADASESEIIGTWKGAGGAALTLEEGNVFTAAKLPLQLEAPSLFSQPFTGQGTWKLTPTGQYEGQRVWITMAGTDVFFSVHAAGKKFRLFLWMGDPDNDQTYWMDKQPDQ